MTKAKFQASSVDSIKSSLTSEVLNYLDAAANDEAFEIKKAIRIRIKSLLEKVKTFITTTRRRYKKTA